MSEVRVRFPPSPTGYLHIGSARTALYNWLFARKHGGKMVLRIEDTDIERSTQASIDGILDGMKWLGLDWDEGPYYQSEYRNEHVATAKRLVEEGHAYKCFCTKEELDRKREAAMAAKTEVVDGLTASLSDADARYLDFADAFAFQAFSCEYIANPLESRQRLLPATTSSSFKDTDNAKD